MVKSIESEHEITDEVLQAARQFPNGWVYKIDGAFSPDEYVPPEAVVGAWQVDANGNPTGEFVKNPNYQPGVSKEENS